MSKIEVDAVEPQSGTSLTLGASGDTITIPSGATISNNGTATGFGATGAVNWDTTAKTANFTAVSKVGYFVDTTSSAITVTLPATPSAGDIVGLVDYAGTFDTNNLIIDGNGEDIEGSAINQLLAGEREGVVLIYVDSTQGWLPISGINEGTDALQPNQYSIDFLVVAGGGGGGSLGGGGGAGGYRTSTETVGVGTAITVTVGDGGAGAVNTAAHGANGSNSSISGSGLTTVTSAGGGGGSSFNQGTPPGGGSGGGGGAAPAPNNIKGSGNTPSTVPSQGNDGGDGANAGSSNAGGGGGGASAVGVAGVSGVSGGNGGAGTASSITGTSVTRAGGGGGSGRDDQSPQSAGGTGGSGGGGNGSQAGNGSAGVVNTGGGGGGGGFNNPDTFKSGAAGGKGVVILSLPLAKFSNTTTGSPTESTSGSNKILVFTGSGSYTA